MANAIAASGYNSAQLATIKATVAADTNNLEFDLFMEACRSYRLDPFRKQIFAVVYNKDKPEKRKMSIIVSRDGYRVLAQRCKDYRPASEKPDIEINKDMVSSENPKGIVSATVRLWKQDNQGEWYPVVGEAYWDEFAPISQAWEYNQEQGKRMPTDRKEVAPGNWTKMPIVMITKCAESQALRAGWPDEFGGVYTEEEMDRAAIEETASEALNRHEQQERQARVGGPGIMFVFDDSMKLEKLSFGSAADRIIEHIKSVDPIEAHKFRIRNEHGLRDLWAHDKAAALEVKKVIEAKESKMNEGNAA